MERLTNDQIALNKIYLEIQINFPVFIGEEETKEACEFVKKRFERLKEYEDLEEQNRLIRLPVAEGTEVYVIYSNYRCGRWEHKIGEKEFEINMAKFWGSEIFPTREEAEARLKELEG